MAVGSPGGSRIIGYTAKAVIAVLDWQLSMQDAVALPNLVNRNGATDLEAGSALEEAKPALEAHGHEVTPIEITTGRTGIRRPEHGLGTGKPSGRASVV